MNVESKLASANISKPTETVTNPTANSTATVDGKSFKDELETKQSDTKKMNTEKIAESKVSVAQSKTTNTNNSIKTAQTQSEAKNYQTKTTDAQNEIKTAQVETKVRTDINNPQVVATISNNVEQNLSAQVSKTQLTGEKTSKKIELSSEIKETSDPLSALKETISTIKSNVDLKVNSVLPKSTFETDSKTGSEITLKMDDKDISFFLNLVQSDQMTAQISQQTGAAANTNNQITEIKTQATQQPVQVSAALLDALSQSAQSGKSVRIDFGDNVAVVMKLDKNGAISANFIPGDTAVENYLRNNISLLQQNFNEKNIAYNELTYSKQQKQEQENQRKNNKEQKDE